jgi:tetratricopeptide (TPR) repeat protein
MSRFSFLWCSVLLLLWTTVVLGEENAAINNPPKDLPEDSALNDVLPQETVRQLIQKLGDDNYIVRQRAEAQLLRIGVGAFAELQRAKNDKDIEIARRAERLLAQFENLFLALEDKSLYFWIAQYAFNTDITEKAGILWILARPFYDAPNGEGLPTLCRIVRFDTEYSLRAEAAKCLMALPPPTPFRQRKWFRTIRDTLSDSGNDPLLQLVSEFARVRCELDELKDAAEKNARNNAKQTEVPADNPVDYPVPLNVDDSIRQRVLRLTDRIAEFQAKPENSAFQSGNMNDILLFYALAEIQDIAGLTAECERSVRAALAVRTESMGNEHPLSSISNEDVKQPFYDHFAVGRLLKQRFRLHWALRHFQLVNAESSNLLLKIDAASFAAETSILLCDYPEAVRCFDQILELVNGLEYPKLFNNAKRLSAQYHAEKSLCLARIAAEEKELAKAKELIQQYLDNTFAGFLDVDFLILGYQLFGSDSDFREYLKSKIDSALSQIEQNLHHQAVEPERRPWLVAKTCNEAAWLLAGTNGDYASALALIEAALKVEPEDCSWLDTLAHVYFLGKKYDKAIEIQENVVRTAPESKVFRQSLERFRKESQNRNR